MMDIDSLINDLYRIRENAPLIHNITNYVVMNNTANALLAIGASPVMAHAVEEVSEMTRLSSALVLNIGTLDQQWLEAMLIAGKTASENSIPIVFDPVGVGATNYRNRACLRILEECRPNIIRGNASEIMMLGGIGRQTKGVDSTEKSDAAVETAKELARNVNAIIAISGAVDYITDGYQVMTVCNGSPMMERVTGMGCTATAVTGAFAAINPDKMRASIHAMAVMGIVGEIAARKSGGNGSLQINFLDELYNLKPDTIRNNIRTE